MIHLYLAHCATRHGRILSIRRILYDGSTAKLFDDHQSFSAVIKSSREGHTDYPGSVSIRGGAEKRINGGTKKIFFGASCRAYGAMLQYQMVIGKRHINVPGLDLLAVFYIGGTQGACAFYSSIGTRRPGELFAVCTTTKREAAKSLGNSLTSVRNTSTPPADAPMTIISFFMGLI